MKKRMIIVTALIMGTLGAGCVSVQASDTLPELTKDNALEQMMKAGETDSLVSNHKISVSVSMILHYLEE